MPTGQRQFRGTPENGNSVITHSPHRITGLETEYGCLVQPPLQVHEVVAQVRDWVFSENRFGLVDLHDRDWDEPAGNGGFLFNGGRVYVDMGHVEYCTPECGSALDVVRYDRAGDAILNEALEALGWTDQVSFIRNNVDHYTGATFGCHENYSLSRQSPLTQKNVLSLLSFLTLRTLYTGAGRVGSSLIPRIRSEPSRRDESCPFQISQRADYIQNDFFEWVQHNRAIINTRDEPLADPRHYRRLHLIHGDTSVLPSTLFLKVGTTRLVFDLLEADDLPSQVLQDAVVSLRELSRNLVPPWSVRMADGRSRDALELLGEFHSRADRRFRGRDLETDSILDLWAEALGNLATQKEALIGIVDWVTKEHLFRTFCESEGLDWTDPWLESQDLEFHHTHPDRSLGLALAKTDGPWNVSAAAIRAASAQPPSDTRAGARGELMRDIANKSVSYVLDWDNVQVNDRERFCLLNPFRAEVTQSAST